MCGPPFFLAPAVFLCSLLTGGVCPWSLLASPKTSPPAEMYPPPASLPCVHAMPMSERPCGDNATSTGSHAVFDIDVDIMPSSLLRGTVLGECHTVLQASRESLTNSRRLSMRRLLMDHFKAVYDSDPANHGVRNVIHYLNSKKLSLFLFRKCRSKHKMVSLFSYADFYDLTNALNDRKKFKFVVFFVKQSTLLHVSPTEVNNSLLDKLNGESSKGSARGSFVAKELSEEEDKPDSDDELYISSGTLGGAASAATSVCTPSAEPLQSSNPLDLLTAPSSANASEQLDCLIGIIKSYLDPGNFDKHLSVLLEGINDLKTNLSDNIEPLNQKLDGLCASILQLTTSPVNPPEQPSPSSSSTHLPRCNVTHSSVICDGCDQPVKGFRYKCVQCYNYDLCEECDSKCFESQGHSKTHQMLRIFLDERPIPFANTSNPTSTPNAFDLYEPFWTCKDIYSVPNSEYKSYAFKTFDPSASVNNSSNSSELSASIWVEDFRYLNISLNSKLDEYNILMSIFFDDNAMQPIENLEIKLRTSSTVLHLDLFDYTKPLTADHSYKFTTSCIDVFFLQITSGNKKYLFQPDEQALETGKLCGVFNLIEEGEEQDSGLKREEDEEQEEEESDDDNDDSKMDVETFDDLDDTDDTNEDEVKEDNSELVLEKETEFTPSLSNSSAFEKVKADFTFDSDIESFHSATNPDSVSITQFKTFDPKHEFEMLGYYVLDFNTNDLEVRVRSTLAMDPKELISLSIVNNEGTRFTSELVNQGGDILVARFPNWCYGDFQLNIREATVHYKAYDYEIFVSSLSRRTVSENSTEPELGTSFTEKAELAILQIGTEQQESEYVFISRTESLIDDHSDYSILSVDDDEVEKNCHV